MVILIVNASVKESHINIVITITFLSPLATVHLKEATTLEWSLL